MEIQNHLGDARRRGALNEGETREYLQLAHRALVCTDRLYQSLRRAMRTLRERETPSLNSACAR